MGKKLIARWESTSHKHWVNMFQDDYGYSYVAPGAGGGLSANTEHAAICEMETRVQFGYFQPDANKRPMKRVI